MQIKNVFCIGIVSNFEITKVRLPSPKSNLATCVTYLLKKLKLVPSLRTDFFVDMSGQSSFRRRQLLREQWSGNKCSDVMTKIQLPVM